MAVGDLNSDAAPDVAITYKETNQVQVFFQKQGSFLGTPDLTFPIEHPGGIVIIDVDQDGTNDLVAVGGKSLYLFLAKENLKVEHKFTDPEQYERRLVAGRFTSQPGMDFLVGPTWKRWSSSGKFSKGYFYGNGSRYAVITDLNHDELMDVVMSADKYGVYLYYAPFANMKVMPKDLVKFTTLRTPYSVNYVAVADMNGDSRPDILAANVTQKDLFFFYQNSPACFSSEAAPSSKLTTKSPFFFATADLNRDGLDDLVLVTYGQKKSSVYVWIQIKGKPLPYDFSAAVQTMDLPGNVRVLQLADINNDGFPDLLIGATMLGGESVWDVRLNSGAWLPALAGTGN
jgi:hypothetical protein